MFCFSFGGEKKKRGRNRLEEILSVRKKKSANRCGLPSITSYLINSQIWDLETLIPRKILRVILLFIEKVLKWTFSSNFSDVQFRIICNFILKSIKFRWPGYNVSNVMLFQKIYFTFNYNQLYIAKPVIIRKPKRITLNIFLSNALTNMGPKILGFSLNFTLETVVHRRRPKITNLINGLM